MLANLTEPRQGRTEYGEGHDAHVPETPSRLARRRGVPRIPRGPWAERAEHADVGLHASLGGLASQRGGEVGGGGHRLAALGLEDQIKGAREGLGYGGADHVVHLDGEACGNMNGCAFKPPSLTHRHLFGGCAQPASRLKHTERAGPDC